MNNPFKSPKNTYYLGKIKFGTPYFYPRNHNKTIFNIYKEKRPYERNKTFKVFGYYVSVGWPIVYRINSIGWKDKFDTPRFEWSPAFYLFFFNWQLCIWKTPKTGDVDNYWEMFLWWKYYYKEYGANEPNITLAKEKWPWTHNGVSTWNDDYVKSRKQNKNSK